MFLNSFRAKLLGAVASNINNEEIALKTNIKSYLTEKANFNFRRLSGDSSGGTQRRQSSNACSSIVDDYETDYSNQINEWQAGWNVTNAIQGMFVVSLPYAIANGGYWALFAMFFISYVCCYTGKILIDCLYEDNGYGNKIRVRASYVDIAKDVWGSNIGVYTVNIAQNIELLMTCILYLVLCGDLLLGIFPNFILDHTSWTMISCMILAPCAFIRNLKLVSKLSFCNAIVHIIINAIIILYCIVNSDKWNWSKIEFKINIWSFPISLGIIVFSYTSQIFLPTLEGNMLDKTKFNKMLYVTHFIAALFKSSFGLVGFLLWQEQTDEIITNNLPTVQLKMLVNFILVVKALLSYPLPYYASLELLETSLFKPKARRNSFITPQTNTNIFPTCYDFNNDLKFWAICLRIGLILFTLALAIFLPHFAILMGLIGSITGTMLSLIWPCYFHLRLKWNQLKSHQICIDIIIIIFGFLITVMGVYYSSIALVDAIQKQHLKSSYYIRNNFYLMKQNFTLDSN